MAQIKDPVAVNVDTSAALLPQKIILDVIGFVAIRFTVERVEP